VSHAVKTALDAFRVYRDGQCLRSCQHGGVYVRVIHECEALRVLRTEMESGSGLTNTGFGAATAFHFVVAGSPALCSAGRSTDLMPGDSLDCFGDTPYTLWNRAPSRSVILTVVLKGERRDRAAEHRHDSRSTPAQGKGH
jgi:hypothetical protein